MLLKKQTKTNLLTMQVHPSLNQLLNNMMTTMNHLKNQKVESMFRVNLKIRHISRKTKQTGRRLAGFWIKTLLQNLNKMWNQRKLKMPQTLPSVVSQWVSVTGTRKELVLQVPKTISRHLMIFKRSKRRIRNSKKLQVLLTEENLLRIWVPLLSIKLKSKRKKKRKSQCSSLQE